MSTSIGVPIKLMHECEGHIVTIELKSGELYRGTLVEAEDRYARRAFVDRFFAVAVVNQSRLIVCFFVLFFNEKTKILVWLLC